MEINSKVRMLKTDDQKQATRDKNKIKQRQDILDKKQKYREMGLDLRRGRYSKEHNENQKKIFYETYGIIVTY